MSESEKETGKATSDQGNTSVPEPSTNDASQKKDSNIPTTQNDPEEKATPPTGNLTSLDPYSLINVLNKSIKISIAESNQEITQNFERAIAKTLNTTQLQVSRMERAIEESAISTLQTVKGMINPQTQLPMDQDYSFGNSTTMNLNRNQGTNSRPEDVPWTESKWNISNKSNDQLQADHQIHFYESQLPSNPYMPDHNANTPFGQTDATNEQHYGNAPMFPARPKGIDPVMMLGQVTRMVKQVYLQNTQVSYLPWLEYVKSLFKACLLNCICLMVPHLVPKTPDHWDDVDNHHGTLQWKDITLQHLRAGKFVEVSKGDGLQKTKWSFPRSDFFLPTTTPFIACPHL